jgi:hypothetical protein
LKINKPQARIYLEWKFAIQFKHTHRESTIQTPASRSAGIDRYMPCTPARQVFKNNLVLGSGRKNRCRDLVLAAAQGA